MLDGRNPRIYKIPRKGYSSRNKRFDNYSRSGYDKNKTRYGENVVINQNAFDPFLSHAECYNYGKFGLKIVEC